MNGGAQDPVSRYSVTCGTHRPQAAHYQYPQTSGTRGLWVLVQRNPVQGGLMSVSTGAWRPEISGCSYSQEPQNALL